MTVSASSATMAGKPDNLQRQFSAMMQGGTALYRVFRNLVYSAFGLLFSTHTRTPKYEIYLAKLEYSSTEPRHDGALCVQIIISEHPITLSAFLSKLDNY